MRPLRSGTVRGVGIAVGVLSCSVLVGCSGGDQEVRRTPPPDDMYMMWSQAPVDHADAFRSTSDTCAGVARLLESSEAFRRQIGDGDWTREYEAAWMLDLVRSSPAWVMASDEERADLIRGYDAAVEGEC
ncbi:hypothetical protein ACWFRB_18800 [Rhodococcus sp. NPDC055112]